MSYHILESKHDKWTVLLNSIQLCVFNKSRIRDLWCNELFFVLLCFETIVLKNYSLEQFTLFSYLIDSFDCLYTWIFFYFMHLTSWWIFSYQNIVSFKFMWKLTWYFISRAFLDLEKNMWTHKSCNLACNLAIANWFKMHMV